MERIETIIYSSRTLGVWRESGRSFLIPLSAEQAYVLGLLAKYGTMERNFSRWTAPKDVVDLMHYLSLTRGKTVKRELMNSFLSSPVMDKSTRREYNRLRRYQRELTALWAKKAIKFDYKKYRVSVRNGRRERGAQHVHLLLTSKRTRFAFDVLSNMNLWLYTKLRDSPMRYLNYIAGNMGIDGGSVTNLVTGRRTTFITPEHAGGFGPVLTQTAYKTMHRCLMNDISPEESVLISN